MSNNQQGISNVQVKEARAFLPEGKAKGWKAFHLYWHILLSPEGAESSSVGRIPYVTMLLLNTIITQNPVYFGATLCYSIDLYVRL